MGMLGALSVMDSTWDFGPYDLGSIPRGRIQIVVKASAGGLRRLLFLKISTNEEKLSKGCVKVKID